MDRAFSRDSIAWWMVAMGRFESRHFCNWDNKLTPREDLGHSCIVSNKPLMNLRPSLITLIPSSLVRFGFFLRMCAFSNQSSTKNSKNHNNKMNVDNKHQEINREIITHTDESNESRRFSLYSLLLFASGPVLLNYPPTFFHCEVNKNGNGDNVTHISSHWFPAFPPLYTNDQRSWAAATDVGTKSFCQKFKSSRKL